MMHPFQMRIKRRLQEWKQKHKLKQAVVVNLVVVVNQDVVRQAAQREQVTGKLLSSALAERET
jgi:RNase P protein component